MVDDLLAGYSRLSRHELSKVTIGDVSVDASVSESHALLGEVTSHKVERGADITDHYRSLPKSITIRGIISNTRIVEPKPTEASIDSDSSHAAGNSTPVLDAWARLKDIFNNKELVTIRTSLETYKSMALTRFNVTRGSHNGDNLSFSATAREVIFVTAKYTDAVKVPKTTRGKKKQETGPDTNNQAPFVPLRTDKPPTKLTKILTEKSIGDVLIEKLTSVPGS